MFLAQPYQVYCSNVLLLVILFFQPILTVTFLIISCLAYGVYQKNNNAVCKSKKMLTGRTVIVTGGTAGMGLVLATDFAERDAKVIIACPFEDEGLEAQKQIIKSCGSDKVYFKILDLASLNSVRKFASDILQSEDRLDILVNNAGVSAFKDFLTADGMSFVMQVNYVGTFLLTLLLLPLLKKTGQPSEKSRIVNTSSVMHYGANLNLKTWMNLGPWHKTLTYENSKFCVVLFTKTLSKKLQNANVVVNAVDPGSVGTTIFKTAGTVFGSLLSYSTYYLSKTPWEGAQTALYVSLSKEAESASGEYFKNCKVTTPLKAAFDEKTENLLWEESIRIVNIKDEEWN